MKKIKRMENSATLFFLSFFVIFVKIAHYCNGSGFIAVVGHFRMAKPIKRISNQAIHFDLTFL